MSSAMNLLCSTAVWAAVACVLGRGVGSQAQTWILTSAPLTNWSCVASSSDGGRLVAGVKGGPIYASTNSGLTWAQTSAPSNSWTSIACSADGSKLFAAANLYGNALIYRSTNSGANWEATSSGQSFWNDVVCSSDGIKVAATYGGYGINISTNSGATWSVLVPSSVPAFQIIPAVASSADGNTLSVVVTDDAMAPSWINITPAWTWVDHQIGWFASGVCTAVANSSDSARIAASVNNTTQPPITNCVGTLYSLSGSTGVGFTNCTPAGGWNSIASSADGMRLVAVATNGSIYTSIDAGATWEEIALTNANLVATASSADGFKLVAAASGGGIYTWQAVPLLTLSLTTSSSALVASWVVPSIPARLQQNSSLSSTDWADVTVPPIVNPTNLHNQVILSPSTGPTFLRLKLLPN